ncbi:MAG: hypothetical protein L6R39_001777 [Caloplaca ligustica]|nr:MAG: hypothetical protein L6R39_001777 [Caloplaca ligustica]
MENLQSSAVTSFINNSKPRDITELDIYQHALAAQVLHNLQYQHDWSSLQIHNQSPINNRTLPKPLVSGLPPHRIYVHPDEQIEMLKQNIQEKDIPVAREWVLPTHLREKWSLRKFADVFDGITEVPSGGDDDSQGKPRDGFALKQTESRRGGKRVLLATVGDDSTVVYYVVHDGIVKPRQN